MEITNEDIARISDQLIANDEPIEVQQEENRVYENIDIEESEEDDSDNEIFNEIRKQSEELVAKEREKGNALANEKAVTSVGFIKKVLGEDGYADIDDLMTKLGNHKTNAFIDTLNSSPNRKALVKKMLDAARDSKTVRELIEMDVTKYKKVTKAMTGSVHKSQRVASIPMNPKFAGTATNKESEFKKVQGFYQNRMR